TEDTCVQILQPGYRIGERIIRPAMVSVAEPQPGTQTVTAPDADKAKDAAKGSDKGQAKGGAKKDRADGGSDS
ncbi:nucleotide exchange factor GrpE, partial [Kitasatospora sp. NPDC093806]|uniref:nucleotide exchange factor GrpE n=1 Tax=Kitasatospora sp. NPDC093806 TaxID=3155075 RepID=UPI0034121B5C